MFDLNNSGRHVTVVETEISHILGQKKTLNILQSELQDRGRLGGDLLHVKQSSYHDRNLQDLSAFSEKKYAGCAVSFGSKNKKVCHLIRKRQISESFCFREEEKTVMSFHQFDLMSVLIKERKKIFHQHFSFC